MEATNIFNLKKNIDGELVALSSFSDGVPFVARLRRPSLLQLAACGEIPNVLLGACEKLVGGGSLGKVSFKETAELVILMAELALVSPTFSELKENGISLTDMQLIEIFNYTQSGVKEAYRFCDGEDVVEGSCC